ncbi:MAG TPA: hypothetical protein VFX91_10675 [Alcanivorax sp.]|nr:hypothetical protein [Alcanivorax sp.]
METDPYDTPRSSSRLGRTARGAGDWLRRHPMGALQILLLILVLIVIAQNLETTSIDVLFWTLASLPKLVLIVISMVIGGLVWEGLRRKLLKPDRTRGATVTNRTHP